MSAAGAGAGAGAGAAPAVWCVGGEDSHLRIAFCRSLAALGFEVTAVGTGDAAPFVRAGVRHLRYRLGRFLDPLGDARALAELAALVARHRPDIVHGFDTKPSLLAPLAAARAGVGRAVRTINGMGYVFSSRSPLALALRPVYRALQRRAAPRTAMAVFQNARDLAYFERHRLVPPSRGRLVPGSGIDVDALLARLPGAEEAARLRRELGLEGRRVVTTVSRLTRQKGIPTLLAAAGRLAARHPDVTFLLVGPRDDEGPFAVPQAALDRHRPYVRALGVRDDVPALLALTDVFILPTAYREGVPRALLEAGAAGRAVVATDMPGCADVVRHGWNGLLVRPGEVAPLADAIEHLLARPELRRAMGERGRALVRDGFALERVARAYADIYEEVLRT